MNATMKVKNMVQKFPYWREKAGSVLGTLGKL
jgi:hypothetical protein